MSLRYEPVHLDATRMDDPQAPARLRSVISGQDGSSTLAWHMVVPPGESLERHVLTRCDEIIALVAGAGVAIEDGDRVAVRAGHCWLIPRKLESGFRNTSRSEPAVLVGFCPGAPDLRRAGYRPVGTTAPAHSEPTATDFSRGALVHLDDVPPANMDAGEGWSISDFRLPLGSHNGSTTTLFRACFLPGAVHRKHRHERCEEIYHVISGHGVAGAGGIRSEVGGGHFHYIPAGSEHWLVNRDAHEPVEVIGIYVGAGSVGETGYVYTGDVTAADLE